MMDCVPDGKKLSYNSMAPNWGLKPLELGELLITSME